MITQKNQKIHAWHDNQVYIHTFQGESGVKTVMFQLTDDKGNIDLSDVSSVAYQAKLPDNKSAFVKCVVNNASQGIVSFTIPTGITQHIGTTVGTISVTTLNGTLKFGNIYIEVHKNDDSGIEATNQFSALEDALNKVAMLTPEGTITVEDRIVDYSVNPPQTKAVYKALSDKADSIIASDNVLYLCAADKILGTIKLPAISMSDIKTAIKGFIDEGLISYITTGKLYVSDFGAKGDGVTDDTKAIQTAIDTAIEQKKKLVFNSGATYIISEPLILDNSGKTKSPFDIDFSNALIKVSANLENNIDSIIKLKIHSNNGGVVSHLENINLDATKANYGIYGESSIRVRFTNVNIINGTNAAFYIKTSQGNIENYIDKFSFWRNEAANVPHPNSYGLYCGATDSYFSNGVVVNYKVACRGGGANYFTNIHPWWWYEDSDKGNKDVMRESVAFRLCGQSAVTSCEFDSCNTCIEQSSIYSENPENPDDEGLSSVKTTVNVVGCSLVVSSLYKSLADITNPCIVKLKNGVGSNITVQNLNVNQTYSSEIYFCNTENEINYDFSETNLLNLPNKEELIMPAGTVSGESLTINATSITVTNAPPEIFVWKSNLMPCEKLSIGETTKNEVTLTVDSDMTMHFSGISTAVTNFYISGTYLNGAAAKMLLKANKTYCIMRPQFDKDKKVNLLFYDGNGDTHSKFNIQSYIGNPYQLYTPTEDIKISGILITIPKDTDVSGLQYKPAIYRAGKPQPYTPPSGQMYIGDYSNIACDGRTHLASTGEINLKYKYGDIASNQELKELVTTVENLKSRLTALESNQTV